MTSNLGVAKAFIVGIVAPALPLILKLLSASSIPIAHDASPCSVNPIWGEPPIAVLIIISASLLVEGCPMFTILSATPKFRLKVVPLNARCVPAE